MDCLCAIGQVVEDLRPFLSIWEQTNSPSALLILAEFVLLNAEDIYRKNRLMSPFWRNARASVTQIIEWLRLPLIRERLEEGFFRYEDQPFADMLAQAADVLYWMERYPLG